MNILRGRTIERMLYAILFFCPVIYLVGTPLGRLDVIFFQVSSLVLIVSWLNIYAAFEFLTPFVVLIFAGVASLFLSGFNLGVTVNVINLFFFCTTVMVIREGILSGIFNSKQMIIMLLLASGGNIAVLFCQKVGLPYPIEDYPGDEGGLMGNAPRLAGLLTILAPFAYKYCRPLFFLYAIASLFLGEIVLCFVCLLTIALNVPKWTRHIQYYIVVLVGAAYVIFNHAHIMQSLTLRYVIWKPTIEVILQKPLFGYGLGVFPLVANQIFSSQNVTFYNNRAAENCFSSFLNVLFSFGIVGGLALISYIWREASFRLDNDKAVLTSLAALFILCIVEYPLEIPRLWMTIAVVVAIFLVKPKPEVV